MTPHDHPQPHRRAVPPRRLHWLEDELALWQRDGLVDESTAGAIRGRYVAGTRAELVRLVVGLGAAFLAVGLLWLVATNLDQFPPLLRLGAVAAVWLGLVVVAEVLRPRASGPEVAGVAERPSRSDSPAPTLSAVCHLLAAAAFGAVIFQAAQSLQVPAYEPGLVAAWSVGALVYAYATGSRGAQAVALLAGLVWLAWFAGEHVHTALSATLLVLAAGLVATAAAAVHVPALERVRPDFAAGWRVVGAGLVLVGIFIAALPVGSGDRQEPWPAAVSVLLGVGAACAVAAVAVVLLAGRAATRTGVRGATGVAGAGLDAADRPGGPIAELSVAAVAVVLGGLLARWQPDSPTPVDGQIAQISGEMWTRTGAGLLLFVALAAWYAVLGARRESGALTGLALAGLVIFTTVQSFAVFAPIVSGATLFLGVGAVMVVTGLAADRLRRGLRPRRPQRPQRPPRPPGKSGQLLRRSTPRAGETS